MDKRQAFEVVTLFPALIESFATQGLMGKAVERGHIEIHATDPRDFVQSGYRSVDDTPFGGGPGMVMQAEPIAQAIEAIEQRRGPSVRVLLTPSAPRFDQKAARALASADRITLLCGRYEGIDDRIRESMVDHCFSLGDFVLNGGEVAALAIIEAVARLREGVLGNLASAQRESFDPTQAGGTTLEHPQYTKPRDWRGLSVPAVLQSGKHAHIDRWRRHTALARTWALRPDLREALSGPRPCLALAVLADDHLDAFGPQLRAQLEACAMHFDAGAWWLGPRRSVPAGFRIGRGLRDVRRALRDPSGADPISVRFWASNSPPPADALNAQALADALDCEDPRESSASDQARTWILLLKCGVGAKDPPFDATLVGALNTQVPRSRAQTAVVEKDRHDLHKLLAKPGALIDISQPAGPDEGSLADAALAVNLALDGEFGPSPRANQGPGEFS